jgi:hypothetical protein
MIDNLSNEKNVDLMIKNFALINAISFNQINQILLEKSNAINIFLLKVVFQLKKSKPFLLEAL